MTRYAEGTSVPMEKSRVEVERTLMRYGATGFHYSWEERTVATPQAAHSPWCQHRDRASSSCTHGCPKTIVRSVVTIGFKMKVPGGERAIRLDVPMPHEREMTTRRSRSGGKAAAEAATRQRWRAIVLVLKAKLEAVAAGISTLDSEFLANVVTGNGQTIGDLLLSRMTEATASGRLLPAAGATP